MKKLIYLLVLMLLNITTVIAQTTEQQIDDLLNRLANGENVEGTTVNIRDVQFETGSAVLNPNTIYLLDKVVQLLERLPNISLNIEGHTDDTGSEAVNNKMSLDRASSVKKYLEEKRINSSRLNARGYGETSPKVANTSEANRAINRRVEFKIQKSEKKGIITIQDIIKMLDGSQKGVVFIELTDDKIKYKDIETNQIILIDKSLVDRIILANGEEIIIDHIKKENTNTEPECQAEEKPKQTIDVKEKLRQALFLFEESTSVPKGSGIFSFGLGLGNNIGVNRSERKFIIPPLHIAYEKILKRNIGIGASFGAYDWKYKSNNDVNLMYFTLSPKVAYHFNLGNNEILKKIDIYSGIATNIRMVRSKSKEADVVLSNTKFDIGLFTGIRYFLKPGFGFFLERGSDGISCNKAGINFKF